MSVLPRAIPPKFTEQLRDALAQAGVRCVPTPKPGSRIALLLTHQGRSWEVRYVAQEANDLPVWQLVGPGQESGPLALTEDVVATITAPPPAPAPPAPGTSSRAPRTHLGFPVPEFVRADWHSERAYWWRLGVATAVGKLPANRPRP
ncbi:MULTISPECIES: hypothetical protein [Streptomyces]|uniref:Uncharacterized protein n=1 Tax=Streptomyces odorifer TaxID=53450 RepID=A0A7Y6CC44_9ACTN|nr:hypothetical protein [Streptomyces odorifer]NUV30880.1 hypothetical protein [Streptomyces odorifer]NUV32892.1 hypothetical protein [Streptomyces sp. KAI-27]NUV45769.1 hypothetical protein [Streptomyces sp. CAI-78]